MGTTGKINVLVAGKTLEPRWLTPELAKKAIRQGVMEWEFASDPDPDIVMVGAGDYPTKEVMAAIKIIKQELPEVRVRCLNIASLTTCGFGQGGTCLAQEGFDRLFTTDKPVICNFHGYPETLKAILFKHINDPRRFDVRGYVESGSTTTPFDMHIRNKTSRYDLAIAAFDKLGLTGKITIETSQRLIATYQQKIQSNTHYIKEYGVDLPEIDAWQWT